MNGEALFPEQMLMTYRLANGLQVVGQPMPDAESVVVAYSVRTGARDEQDPRLEGISHFLEHMLFKGTETMDRQQLDRAFTQIGAKRNGFTSIEYTLYYAHVLSEHLERALELLRSMMYPRLLQEEFEAEKEVILNEIARSEDQPQSFARRQMMRAYFGAQPLGNNVLGTHESIHAMHLEQMQSYWQEQYSASHVTLSIAGKFPWEPFLSLAERYGNAWHTAQPGQGALLTPRSYEPALSSQRVIVHSQRKQQIIMLTMPMVARESADYTAAMLGARVLGRPKGSRLYWRIVHQGLAISASASLWAFQGTGLLLLQTNVMPQQAQRVLYLLWEELDRLLEEGPTEDELQRAKALWISDVIQSAERPYAQMWTLTDDWRADGHLVSLSERIARIEQVTVEDVRRVFRRFPLREKQVLTAYGPLSEHELCS